LLLLNEWGSLNARAVKMGNCEVVSALAKIKAESARIACGYSTRA